MPCTFIYSLVCFFTDLFLHIVLKQQHQGTVLFVVCINWEHLTITFDFFLQTSTLFIPIQQLDIYIVGAQFLNIF